jgi:hypothetical protein
MNCLSNIVISAVTVSPSPTAAASASAFSSGVMRICTTADLFRVATGITLG